MELMMPTAPRLAQPLVWMDLEMTGLDPDRDRILEIAVVVSDGALSELVEGPDLVIHQPPSVLAGMDEWNTRHHGESGLTDRVAASKVDEAAAQEQVLTFLRQHVGEASAPLAGNSVHQDRAFLRRWMGGVHAFLHYRNVDVSTVKELARRWAPEVLEAAPVKTGNHRALDDIRESIRELAHYRTRLGPAWQPGSGTSGVG
jgi:oligoribonuclease